MEYLYILWLGLFPYILLWGAYEGPKVYWLWLGGMGVIVYFIVRLLAGKIFHIPAAGRWFLCWITLLSVSSLFGVHPVESFLGGSYRHQGVLFFLTLLFISLSLPYLSSRTQRYLGALLSIGVLFESIIVLIERTVFHVARPLGTFGEPNAVGGYLSVGLFWILSERRISVVIRALVTCCVVAAIVCTQSRTGLVVAGIVLFGFSIPVMLSHRHKVLLLGIMSGCVVSLGVLGYVYARVISITRPVSQYENRKEFWTVGFVELTKKPVFGYGAESLEFVYDRAYAGKSFPLADFMIDRSHNIFLDVALWSGIAGLIVCIGWFGMMFRMIYLKRDTPRLFALIGWLIFASLQPVGVVHWVGLILLTSI